MDREKLIAKYSTWSLKNLFHEILNQHLISEKTPGFVPTSADWKYEAALDVFSDKIIALGGEWPKIKNL